jgi:hypothetical protein
VISTVPKQLSFYFSDLLLVFSCVFNQSHHDPGPFGATSSSMLISLFQKCLSQFFELFQSFVWLSFPLKYNDHALLKRHWFSPRQLVFRPKNPARVMETDKKLWLLLVDQSVNSLPK